MKKDFWMCLAAGACGAAIWFVVAEASGRREAWDSGLYFSFGMPAVCLVSLALGFVAPVRTWRWGVAPLAGQFAWMLLTQGIGNLLPLGMLVFALLSLPAIFAARFGAFIARRKAMRDMH